MEAALREPSQKLRSICARLRESTASKAASNGAPTEDAHTTLLRAAEAASQQVRAFYFLLQSSPPASDAAACAAELVEAVLKYESWARSVADAMAPVSRRLIGPPCQAVLQAICAIVEKAARGDEVRAPDVGKVQEASAALAELPVSPAAACARLLRESVALLSDAALRSHFESAVEAGGHPKAMANWIRGPLARWINIHSDEEPKLESTELVQLERAYNPKI